MTELTGIPKFERLFREAAGLDVDKNDLKRMDDFVNQKLYDLLIAGQATAKANGRDIIEPRDLPITKGLQERINEFKKLEVQLQLRPILDRLAMMPMLDLDYSDQTREGLPDLMGALIVALAKLFKLLDPELKNPQSEHWEKAFGIFNLLL